MMEWIYLTVSVMVTMVECQPVGHHQPSSLSSSVSGLSTNLLLSMNQTQSPGQNVIISPVRRPCQVVAYVTAPDCHIPLASLPQCTLTLAKDLQEYLFALFFFGIQT